MKLNRRSLLISAAGLALPGGALAALQDTAGDPPLQVTHVGLVAPDIIGITIDQGRTEHARQVPYVAQPDDRVLDSEHGPVWVIRGGQTIGSLAGLKRDVVYTFDRVVGKRLDAAAADRPETYRVSSTDDPAFGAQGLVPVAVYRKTKPTDRAEMPGWKFDWPLRHVIYLRLPRPLKPGARYAVDAAGLDLGRIALAPFRPESVRSEAVHVSHLGFRPDDSVKAGFLSIWLGSGGAHKYAAPPSFRLIDDATGKTVFSGIATLSKAADDATEDPYKRNYNLTDVHVLDFSAVSAPGMYRVVVEGIGCSYPFPIGAGVWRDAFAASVKGLYYQRSGIPIEPPYSSGFRRPRPFHPADGVVVRHSTTPLMDTGNGINARGTDKNNFGNLVKGKTDTVVPDAWGGYFDAGDWDRRIQHLSVTNNLFELLEMLPGALEPIRLNIPESKDDLPDVVNEALWTLDFFKRLQTPDGGIRGGIESSEHPRRGEASWQETLTVMAYAPDMWCSYLYAASAARAALWLKTRKPEMSRSYADSALKAMAWAEKAFAGHDYAKLPHDVPDGRNLAAAELFRLTGDAAWNDIFVRSTIFTDPKAESSIWQHHDQRDAAFVYARIDRPGVDAAIRANCVAVIRRDGDAAATLVGQTGLRWTKRRAWDPIGYGRVTVPQAIGLIRAHHLTKDAKYLQAALWAAQYGAGANPANLCFTTGLGHDSPRHPLIVDQRVTNQPVPPGITVFGPDDMTKSGNNWMVKLFAPVTYPAPTQWPSTEAYFDVYHYAEQNEYVIPTIADNAYTWGYLAGRDTK